MKKARIEKKNIQKVDDCDDSNNKNTNIILEKKLLNYINKNSTYILIGLFIAIVIIKVMLSLQFIDPYVMWDEALYDNIAHNVIQGKLYSDYISLCGPLCPGYSIFISIAYLLSSDKAAIYHIMLVLNAILTTSVVFPAYLIIKRYCSTYTALLSALLITVLPSIFSYTFTLWTENVFTTLTIFSLFFIIKSFETNDKVWELFASLSVVYLYITRVTGLAMIIAFILSIVYYIYIITRTKDILTPIKQKWFLMTSFIVLLVGWVLYSSFFMYPSGVSESTANNYSSSGGINYMPQPYSAGGIFYISQTFSMLTNFDQLIHIIQVLLVQIDYTVIASFFILLFIIIFIVNRYNGLKNFDDSFKIGFVYSLISIVSMILITTIFILNVYYPEYGYILYGRYLDPIVPLVVLMGIVGIENMIYNSKKNKNLLPVAIFIIGVLIVILSMDFNYKYTVEIFSLLYILLLNNTILIYVSLLALAALSFIILYGYNKKINYYYMVLIVLILVAIIATTVTYKEQVRLSDIHDPIIGFFKDHSNDNYTIFMENKFDQSEDYDYFGLAIFWNDGKVKLVNVTNTSLMSQFEGTESYIVSKDLLPFPKILNGTMIANGRDVSMYRLYSLNTRPNKSITVPYTIDFNSLDWSMVQNFEPSDIKQPWTRNDSKVEFEYPSGLGPMNIMISTGGFRPENDSAHMQFFINGNFIGEANKSNGIVNYSFSVPLKDLEEHYQVLEIKTNTWRPSDYGLKGNDIQEGYIDNRDLGVTVNWIKIDKAY